MWAHENWVLMLSADKQMLVHNLGIQARYCSFNSQNMLVNLVMILLSSLLSAVDSVAMH